MRTFAFCLILTLLCGVCAAQTFYGTTDVEEFRAGRDKEFRNKDESPLLPSDLLKFEGLNYFPVSRKYRVTATLTRTPGEKVFQMPTSSGVTKKFVKYGELSFRFNGRPQRLSVYQSDEETRARFPEYADLLFIPFRDRSNRSVTYAGGRYIDIRIPKGKSVVLDLNLAYNPNCAYGSDKYNCPIPPRENTLDVAILAGEKRFEYAGSKYLPAAPSLR